MGFRIDWVLLDTGDVVSVAAELGMRLTGQRDEFPERTSIARTAANQSLLWVEGHLEEHTLLRLSRRWSLLHQRVNETVMHSACGLYAQERCVWSVDYASERSRERFQVDGQPPAEFESLRARAQADQPHSGGCDLLFDVPVDLAASIVGFRYDAMPEETEPLYLVLARVS